MNRKDDGGSGLDDLMGLVIGLVGVVCIWLAGFFGGGLGGLGGLGGGGLGWVSDPDGEILWFEDGRWVGHDEDDVVDGAMVGLVVLVHGLDEPGGIWDDVAPALALAGHRVVRFDYPNDQAIGLSALGLSRAMGGLSGMGVGRVSIVAHSMGGLVSREALTNPELGDGNGRIAGVEISRLILVGTPNEGSAWARLRGVAEVRERVQRWMASEDMDLSILANLGEDGDGQAGVDLLPGSDFLMVLNGRPMPGAVAVTCIIGRVVDPLATAGNRSLDDGANALGDGVVSVESASLDGCGDIVMLVANHRSLLRVVEFEESWRAMVGAEVGDEPGGIAVILDRLKGERPR